MANNTNTKIRKVVILAGGQGTRISEETHLRPKPMIEVGGRPILWHIMKIYSYYGLNDFIICLGYKGSMIKEFFSNYYLYTAATTFNLKTNTAEIHHAEAEPWRVTLVETGDNTMTGGRLKRVAEYLGGESFCFTYGDGVANIKINELLAFHEQEGTLATVTAVRPPARFGAMHMENNRVTYFQEKPIGDNAWINGGFFVLKPEAINYIESDETSWESTALSKITQDKQLAAFRHEGFWQPMDTLRDKQYLQGLWDSNTAPWRVWDRVEEEAKNSPKFR